MNKMNQTKAGDDVNRIIHTHKKPISFFLIVCLLTALFVNLGQPGMGGVAGAANQYMLEEPDVSDFTGTIPQSGMSATAADEHSNNYQAGYAIDGNTGTWWHTSWIVQQPLPQSITVKLDDDQGTAYRIHTVKYLPKQSFPGDNGIITSYRLLVSLDNVSYNEVAAGSWNHLNLSEKEIVFDPVIASYIRLEAVTGVGGYASVAEINVIAEGLPEPEPTPTPTPEPTPTPAEFGTVPHSQMTAEADSSEPGYEAAKAIDGNTATAWHSSWTNTVLPESLTLNLGAEYAVSTIRVWPKQTFINDNGMISQYEIHASIDGVQFDKIAEGVWATDPVLKVVKFDPVDASYIRITAIAGTSNLASIAEIEVDYGIDPEELVKIMLSPDMVYDEASAFRGIAGPDVGFAIRLVDEQEQAGDPVSSSCCSSGWNPAWESAYYPASAYIDLGRTYKIKKVYLNDMNGSANIALYTGTPFNWDEEPFVLDPLLNYGRWNEHLTDVETRYVRVVMLENGGAMNELVLYGYPVGDLPEPPPTPEPHVPIHIPLHEAIGATALFIDPVDKMGAVGHVREYHPWNWDEQIEGENKYNPAYPGEEWNFDAFYQEARDAGVMVYTTIMQNVPWLTGGVPANLYNKPFIPGLGLDPEDPETYRAHADKMFQTVARYGSVSVPDELLKLAPGQPRETGMGLIEYYENWNEPNQTFRGRHGFFHPYELAAMTSADYDGHEGKLGTTVGVKNADPNAKLVMAGLMDTPDMLEYIKRMNEWFYYNRDDRKFAADVINVHYYASDGRTGISPEAAGMKESLQEVVEYAHEHIPNREVWLSEFGWDSHPGTLNSAPSLEVHGQWIIRGFMAAFAAGINRATLFAFTDAIPNGSGRYDTSGLIGDSEKPAWYYVYTMRNTLRNMVFDSEVESGNPNVLIYKFTSLDNSTSSYVLWSPTSNGTVVADYALQLPETADQAVLTLLESGATAGIQSTLEVEDGQVLLNVSEKPLFVTIGQIAQGLEMNGPDQIILPDEGQSLLVDYSVLFTDQNGAPMPSGDVSWAIEDENGLPVDGNLLRMEAGHKLFVMDGIAPGDYTLTAVSLENSSWIASKVITLKKADPYPADIAISGQRTLDIPSSGSDNYNFNAIVLDQFGVEMTEETVEWTIWYESSKPILDNSLEVDSQGVLTVNSEASPGYYILRATVHNGLYRTRIIILEE